MSKTQLIAKFSFDENRLSTDLEMIDTFPSLEEEYSEFGCGAWLNHSLWNESGDENDTQYRDYDTPTKLTPLGRQLNYINDFQGVKS